MIPRSAINQLIEDGVAEALEGEKSCVKPAVEATAAEQCLFAAMPPSWNRDKLLQRHYPEHFRLLSSNSAEKPAAGESLLASGRAGASNPQQTLIGEVAQPATQSECNPAESFGTELCAGSAGERSRPQ